MAMHVSIKGSKRDPTAQEFNALLKLGQEAKITRRNFQMSFNGRSIFAHEALDHLEKFMLLLRDAPEDVIVRKQEVLSQIGKLLVKKETQTPDSIPNLNLAADSGKADSILINMHKLLDDRNFLDEKKNTILYYVDSVADVVNRIKMRRAKK